MALSKLTEILNVHQSQPDQPTITATELKQRYDQDVNTVKDFINDTLTVEVDTLDANNVKLSGNQTIDGIKTFNSSPVAPTPTINNQVANKNYVDSIVPSVVVNQSFLGGGLAINGDMSQWQRDTNFINPDGVYTADRMEVIGITDNNATVSQDVAVTDGFEYSMRIEENNGSSTGQTDVLQTIEYNSIVEGKEITFSAGLKIDAGIEVDLLIIRNGVPIVQTKFIGDGTYQIYSVTATPSATITVLSFRLRLNRNGIAIGKGFNLQYMKVEYGSYPTAYVPKFYFEELIDCQRYLYKLSQPITDARIIGIGYALSTTLIDIMIELPVQMRINPTIILNDLGGSISLRGEGVSIDVTTATFTVQPSTDNIITFRISGVVGLVTRQLYALTLNQYEILLSAEI